MIATLHQHITGAAWEKEDTVNNLVHELKHEHNVIMQVARGMKAAADLLDSKAEVEPSVIAAFVQFLRMFAGRCHGMKEEKYLFPLLAAKGNIRANQEIEALEKEHRIAVQFVDELASLSIAYSQNPLAVPFGLAAALRSLAELYSGHIWREDYLLFPIAQQTISESEREFLRNKFEGVEMEIGADVHTAFEMLAVNLEALVEYRDADVYRLSPAA